MKKGLKITLITLSAVVGTALLSLSIMILPHKGLASVIADNMRISTMGYSKKTYTGTTYTDIQYSDVSKTDTFDLYMPKDVENPKLMVLIHGGGFFYGNSKVRQARFMYEHFWNDYAVASINYRLSGEAQYPAAVQDVKSALRFLTFNASTYGYDANDLVIWGESAGGYLATMATLSPDTEYNDVPFIGEDKVVEPVRYDIGTLLDYYGLLQLETFPEQYKQLDVPNWLTTLVGNNLEHESDNSIMSKFFGEKVCDMSDDKLSEINPLSRITQNSKYDFNVYITHGTSDITVPYLQGSVFESKIKDHTTGKVRFDLKDHYKHADDRYYTKENLSSMSEIIK